VISLRPGTRIAIAIAPADLPLAIHLPRWPEDAWLAWPCESIAMRTLVCIVAVVIMCGCAGTGGYQRAGQPRGGSLQATPVVTEQPSLSDRLKYSRQQEAEQAAMSMTEVHGTINR
jgi:hypothetical protein